MPGGLPCGLPAKNRSFRVTAGRAAGSFGADRKKGCVMRKVRIVACVAACLGALQPCLAAELPREGGAVAGRMGAFAGAGVAVPLGTARRAAPRARLQVGPAFALVDVRTGALTGSRRAAGIELGLDPRGAPALSIAGRSGPELTRRIGFKGSTGYIIVGGVVLAVALLAAVAAAQPKPGPQPGDFPG